MTPKEKAVELYEKYFYLLPNHSTNGDIEHLIAKKCAIIAVDEILDVVNDVSPYEIELSFSYWIKVKSEIEKL